MKLKITPLHEEIREHLVGLVNGQMGEQHKAEGFEWTAPVRDYLDSTGMAFLCEDVIDDYDVPFCVRDTIGKTVYEVVDAVRERAYTGWFGELHKFYTDFAKENDLPPNSQEAVDAFCNEFLQDYRGDEHGIEIFTPKISSEKLTGPKLVRCLLEFVPENFFVREPEYVW